MGALCHAVSFQKDAILISRRNDDIRSLTFSVPNGNEHLGYCVNNWWYCTSYNWFFRAPRVGMVILLEPCHIGSTKCMVNPIWSRWFLKKSQEIPENKKKHEIQFPENMLPEIGFKFFPGQASWRVGPSISSKTSAMSFEAGLGTFRLCHGKSRSSHRKIMGKSWDTLFKYCKWRFLYTNFTW